ncbi:MAG: NAD(P)-dependent oxidoreductase [Rhodospirillaceae bacterium]
MTYLPILIDIRNQDVLVVGEGHLAARKARVALRAGAKVRLLTSDAAGLDDVIADDNCRLLTGAFTPEHLRGVRLAFAATADEDLAHRVSRAAREAGIPVNVADRTALCSFIMPATVNRGPIVVAVSTGGDAPILTRTLRARLETLLPADLSDVADFDQGRRGKVTEALAGFDDRRKFWDAFMEGPIPERLAAGDAAVADALFDRALAEWKDGRAAPVGSVALIGCGPGDPDLLTFKALRLMQQADLAAVAPEVPSAIVERVRRDAETVIAASDATTAERIAAWVDAGKAVVRLGPGDFPSSDPGRAEAAALAARGIRAIVVAGVAG